MPTSVVASPAFRSLSLAGIFLVVTGCATTGGSPAASNGPIGYVTDGSGNLARTGSGGCVRTGSWQQQYAIKECDPELYAQLHPAPREPEPSTAQTQPAPQEPQTAVAEAPAAAEPEPAPEPRQVFIGADTYFGFGETELAENGKRALDLIAERATQAENPQIRIVGYADQVGPEDYNLTLSQRRADAVRTYLIERGVPENALTVDARGEDDPIVRCEGRQGATLIDCLQPNRRTEVEFSALEPVQ